MTQSFVTPMLSDGTVRLRAPEPSDTDMMYLWENDPELWECGTGVAPVSRHQLVEYIDNYDGDIYSCGQLRMVVELEATGEAVGTLDFTHCDARDRHARVGIFIAPAYRRRGLASRVLSVAKPYAASTLGLHMLMALVAADNDASRALFAAAGFSTCGRVRSYLRRGRSFCDIILYQVLL